jgi:MoxR-like ATPase
MSVGVSGSVVVAVDGLAEAAAAATAYGEELGDVVVARDAEIRSLLLALVAQKNVLLLGPPGTAKSLLASTFAAGLGWRYFARLLGKTTQPEELFGPFNLNKLKASVYERCIEGYLPTAQVAFLDETFKGSSAILNGLLTIINERQFDQGTSRIAVPLELVIGASNELPQEEGLAAIYDRFLIRHQCRYIADDDTFSAMLTAPAADQPELEPRYVDTLRAAARVVTLDHLVPAILKIRAELGAEKIVASDRRWRQSLDVVRASAALAGRTVALSSDLMVLADTLWDRPGDSDKIRAVVTRNRNPNLTAATKLHAAWREAFAKLPPLTAQLDNNAMASFVGNLQEVTKILEEAKKFPKTDPEANAVIEMVKAESKPVFERAATIKAALSNVTK